MSEEEKLRDYLKRAIADSRRAKARLLEVEAQVRGPIAIVGMACRFPLGITSPEALWAAVSSGADAVGPFPADRGWRDEQFEPPSGGTASSRTREGAFLTDPGAFDAGFFGISPREALSMDPQQRQLLETSWEALERAGLDPLSLHGSDTGVFVGGITQEYPALLAATGLDRDGYALTGTTSSVMSGRVAYTLGLEGPAVTVDTACSSSLVAIHLAAHALRSGECGLALAGGVNLMATPQFFTAFSGQGAVAEDGRCKSFAAAADGIGIGEGVGVLVLERLGDAQRNGRRVLAVVSGSAVNSDGASNGLTAPNGPAQQRVIRRALASAQLGPSDVDVVEAHGTGTKLGDPIEAQAVLAAYGRGRPADRPLWLGSAKSNFGHTQAAAGITGVIKMVMALRHGLLPATLHVDAPTPHVDWSAAPVRLLTEAQPWPAGERTRRAGVSSFGISGTNAHVIVAEAPTAPEPEPVSAPAVPLTSSSVPWVLSGRSASAVPAQAARLLDHLVERAGTSAVGVARALAGTRSAFRERAVVLAEPAGLMPALGALARAESAAAVVTGVATGVATGGGRPVFVFPGQGGQWAGMATGLMASSPIFAARMAECVEALAPHLDYSPIAVLLGEPGAPPLDRVDVTQVVNFAVLLSLAALWQACGVEPAAVIGHSQGEVAAACVAGALPLAEAARIIAVRGREARALDGAGGLLSVWASAEVAADLIVPWAGQLTVGAVNGPGTVIISGDEAALGELAEVCTGRGIRARRVAMKYASHSRYVEPIRHDLLRGLGEVVAGPATATFYSTVTGAVLDTTTLDAGYWYRNLREPVRMHDAVQAALDDGCAVFIEVSPHPVLVGAIQDGIAARGLPAVALGSLRREQPEADRMLRSLAEAYVAGAPVDWAALLGPAGELPVELPTYAFQHERYWVEPPVESIGAADSAFWDAVGDPDPAALAAALELTGAEQQASLRVVTPALARWHRRRQERSTLDSWRYRVTWRRVDPPPATLLGRWLIVTAEGQAGPEASAFAAAGADVVRLELPPGVDRAALADRLRDVTVEHGEFTGVLAAVGLDLRPDERHNALSVGAVLTLTLAQALTDVAIDARLWLLTRGAELVVPADQPAAEGAAVAGLARVIGLENPGTWGGIVDLPGDPARADADAVLLATLVAGAAEHNEDQVAIRAGGIFVRRLTRAGRSGTAGQWRPRGTVLITGGTGGIGLEMARWLAGHGAEHLVLTSRRGAAAEGVDALRDELGIPVTVAACDVADRTALAKVLAEIPADVPLTAVVHAAGVGSQQAFTDLDATEFARVAAGKVAGARNLDDLLGDQPLDAFVLFSSAAAVWGTAGMAAYSAANAYLDGLAARRRAAGRTATSIAWGGWAGAGMGRLVTGDAHDRQGVRAMPPARALAAMRAAVDQRDVAVTVADVDWPRFGAVFSLTRHRRLFDEIPEAAATGDTVDDSRAAELVRRLTAAPGTERDEILRALVRAEAAAVLGFASADELTPGTPFKDLGFTSVTAVELRQKLAARTGLSLPATLVFDHPTVDAVAGLVRDRLLGDRAQPSVTSLAPTAEPVDDPVVIIGMACRYPGGVSDPETMWTLLAEGVDAVGPFPGDRGWDAAGRGDYLPEGGFLHDAAHFDHAFFGISPREAQAMDPQQRLLLESTWEALERSGIDPAELRGSRTGVFIGAGPSDYSALLGAASGGAEGFAMTGTAGSIVSGRISYVLGLEGPAITLDTGCSSSLVTIHLAAQSLRNDESTLAVAGGVTVMSTPVAFTEFARQGGLAADARCKSFAGSADGTGWSEGVGLVVLERHSAARRQGHPVLAVLRGSAINQDGASNGLTAPNGPAQERVIRAALASAALGTADVAAVEAHGTGTTLGDPIEAQALLATYGRNRDPRTPLWLGSIKSNIGHTQAAAGVAGVLKMILAMRHELLPRTLHVDEPTPHADWSAGQVRLLVDAQSWPRGDRPRRAAVSSFGISGTNAHLIIEEPAAEPLPGAPGEDGALPVLVSARTAEGLRAQAGRLAGWLARHPELAIGDVAYSLMTTRTAFDHRAVVSAGNRETIRRGLAAIAEGRAVAGVAVNRTRPAKVVFVFPGQGAQWAGMATTLWAASPVFAETMAACEEAIAPYVDWSVREVVHEMPGAPSLQRVDVVQPVLFAVMVSLAALWRSCGVHPSAVIGHSQGEIAAACVAGALSLADGARVVTLRSKAIRALAGTGGMTSVDLPLEQVTELLERWAGRLGVAAVNGPRNIVVSGDADAIAELVAHCTESDVRARRIAVDYASHSAQVELIRDEVRAALDGITPRAAEVPFYSTLTAGVLSGEELDADYWFDNLRHPVLLRQAAEMLDADGFGLFVECSPHPVLSVGLQDTMDARGSSAAVLGSLRRDQGGMDRFRAALAEAYVSGAVIDWSAALRDVHVRAVELPTYAFQRTRHWLDRPVRGTDVTGAGLTDPGHPLLAAGVELAETETAVFTGRISRSLAPWLADHVLGGVPVLPATAVAEMVAKAGRLLGYGQVAELVLHAAIVVPASGTVDLQLTVGAPDDGGRRAVQLHGRSGAGPWSRHAGGWLALPEADPVPGDLRVWPPAGAEPVPLDDLYGRLAAAGVDLGPSFQGLQAAWTSRDTVYAEIAPPPGLDAGYVVHPAVLDAALQPVALGEVVPGGAAGKRPFSFTDLTLTGDLTGSLRVRLTPAGPDAVTLLLADSEGNPVGGIGALTLRAAPIDEVRAGSAAAYDGLFRLDWVSAPSSGSVVSVPATARPVGFDAVPPGGPAPDLVVVRADGGGRDARAAVLGVLDVLRAWSEDERFAGSRLAVVTSGAVAAGPEGDLSDPAGAAVWGLIRAAQAEHPGRFLLVDVEDPGSADRFVSIAAGLPDEEQIAVRGSDVLVPRLARLRREDDVEPIASATFGAEAGTVLVTGATGGVGALVARHLVTGHGVRRLLLLSRRGPDAPGAGDLVDDLRERGAEVVLAACDVGDRAALAEVLARETTDHPVTAVVHAAGIFDDATLGSMTAEQVDRVFRAKVDAARNLDELTAGLPLTAFVLFSSSAGVFGGAGQASYSSANAYLDGFAHERRLRGLPGLSLAWGLWADERGMGGQIGETQRRRHGRRGIAAMSAEDALALFDAACASAEPALLPMRLDWPSLHARARVTGVPPLLRGLVRVARRQAGNDSRELTRRLAGMSAPERVAAVTDMVRDLVAGVLGYESRDAVDPELPFRDLGFDSLTAVELRNMLNAATGLRLPVTAVFDHPHPVLLAEHLAEELSGADVPAGNGADPEEARVRGLLASVPLDRLRTAGLLEALIALGDDEPATDRPADRRAQIEAMDADELIRMAMAEEKS